MISMMMAENHGVTMTKTEGDHVNAMVTPEITQHPGNQSVCYKPWPHTDTVHRLYFSLLGLF